MRVNYGAASHKSMVPKNATRRCVGDEVKRLIPICLIGKINCILFLGFGAVLSASIDLAADQTVPSHRFIVFFHSSRDVVDVDWEINIVNLGTQLIEECVPQVLLLIKLRDNPQLDILFFYIR